MKVVVIGGGVAGLATCTSIRNELSSSTANTGKDVEIILIEPKDYFEVFWAAYRSPFDETTANDAITTLSDYITSKSITHVQAYVTKLNHKTRIIELSNDHENIKYDICIICAGTQNKWIGIGRGLPTDKNSGAMTTRTERLQLLQKEGAKLVQDVSNNKSILIIGGGLIGVELAGDLAYYSTISNDNINKDNISITLVHSGEHLCHTEFTSKAGKMAKNKLESLGVKVIVNDKAMKSKDNENEYILNSTKEVIKADRIIMTTGITPTASTFIDKSLLDKKGYIIIDHYFRTKNNDDDSNNRLFAFGDCCDMLPKAGHQILGNMKQIGTNVKAVIIALQEKENAATTSESTDNNDNDDETIKVNERQMSKILISSSVFVATIGKEMGVAQTPLFHTQLFLPWLKNKTMFLWKIKSDVGI